MADINISVDATTDLFAITMDKDEWTALYIKVDGKWVNVERNDDPDSDIQFQYKQPIPSGPLSFKAVANSNVVIINPFVPMFMSCSDSKRTYFGTFNYKAGTNEVYMFGLLETIDVPMPNAVRSPILFCQSGMTGTFRIRN